MTLIRTAPVVLVVTCIVRTTPVLSGNLTVAAMPDTRDAEHVVSLTGTVNMSVILPGPEREAPSRPLIVAVPSAVNVTVSEADDG